MPVSHIEVFSNFWVNFSAQVWWKIKHWSLKWTWLGILDLFTPEAPGVRKTLELSYFHPPHVETPSCCFSVSCSHPLKDEGPSDNFLSVSLMCRSAGGASISPLRKSLSFAVSLAQPVNILVGQAEPGLWAQQCLWLSTKPQRNIPGAWLTQSWPSGMAHSRTNPSVSDSTCWPCSARGNAVPCICPRSTQKSWLDSDVYLFSGCCVWGCFVLTKWTNNYGLQRGFRERYNIRWDWKLYIGSEGYWITQADSRSVFLHFCIMVLAIIMK